MSRFNQNTTPYGLAAQARIRVVTYNCMHTQPGQCRSSNPDSAGAHKPSVQVNDAPLCDYTQRRSSRGHIFATRSTGSTPVTPSGAWLRCWAGTDPRNSSRWARRMERPCTACAAALSTLSRAVSTRAPRPTATEARRAAAPARPQFAADLQAARVRCGAGGRMALGAGSRDACTYSYLPPRESVLADSKHGCSRAVMRARSKLSGRGGRGYSSLPKALHSMHPASPPHRLRHMVAIELAQCLNTVNAACAPFARGAVYRRYVLAYGCALRIASRTGCTP